MEPLEPEARLWPESPHKSEWNLCAGRECRARSSPVSPFGVGDGGAKAGPYLRVFACEQRERNCNISPPLRRRRRRRRRLHLNAGRGSSSRNSSRGRSSRARGERNERHRKQSARTHFTSHLLRRSAMTSSRPRRRPLKILVGIAVAARSLDAAGARCERLKCIECAAGACWRPRAHKPPASCRPSAPTWTGTTTATWSGGEISPALVRPVRLCCRRRRRCCCSSSSSAVNCRSRNNSPARPQRFLAPAPSGNS